MRIYKPSATKPIPVGATIDRKKGLVSYKARGRTRTAALTDNGRMRIETKTWRIEFKDHHGRRQTISAFTDANQSRLLAADIEMLIGYRGQQLPTDLAKRIAKRPKRIMDGLVDIGLFKGTSTAGTRTLADLLNEFETSLRSRELCAKHIEETAGLPRMMFEDLGIDHVHDITIGAVEGYLKLLRDGAVVRKGKPIKAVGYRRSNAYLTAVKAFLNWLVRRGYANENPLATMKKLNQKIDRRHVRRALTVEELKRLLAATKAGPVRKAMTGYERYLLYLTAIQTGLRRNELRQLTKNSFDFERHTVTVEAVTTKGKRQDVQYITADLSAEIATFLANKLPTAKAFGGETRKELTMHPTVALKRDLADAGIPYADDAGRVFDFHSLRGQCATLLAMSGVPMKTAQKIMRHTDINLTANVYTHILHGQERAAIEALPDLCGGDVEAEKNLKTGTDDVDVTPKSLLKVCVDIGQHETKSASIRQVTRDSGPKTAIVDQKQGYDKTSNPKVAGSSPAGRVAVGQRLPERRSLGAFFVAAHCEADARRAGAGAAAGHHAPMLPHFPSVKYVLSTIDGPFQSRYTAACRF